MQSGEEFNELSNLCDFYVTTANANDDVATHLFANIRYVFDYNILSEQKFIHLVEIPDDAVVELGMYYYKSNKLTIKQTWTIDEFLKLNKLRIQRMIPNRHLFNEFDDVNHMTGYSV